MRESHAEDLIHTPVQGVTLALLAGLLTALLVSLIAALLMSRPQNIPPASLALLLTDFSTGFGLSLVVSLPFGLLLAPTMSFLDRSLPRALQGVFYPLAAGGVAQLILPYSPKGDGLPFFAFAALGGLCCLLLERRLARSNRINRFLHGSPAEW